VAAVDEMSPPMTVIANGWNIREPTAGFTEKHQTPKFGYAHLGCSQQSAQSYATKDRQSH
jgi:hypothetical protein